MNVCSVTECAGKAIKRGWCHNHYERWRRNGHPTKTAKELRAEAPQEAVEPTEKACKKCGEVKPLDAFYRRVTPSLWYYTKCKVCVDVERTAKRLQKRLDNPPAPRTPVDHGECAFHDCHRKAKTQLLGKGGPEGWYCGAHYLQWDANRELTSTRVVRKSYINDKFRRCTACDTVKPQDDFHNRTGGGKQGQCRACYYKVVRTNILVKEGRVEEALAMAESMPDNIREKYVGKCLNAINALRRGEES